MDEIVLIERKLPGDRKASLYLQRLSEATFIRAMAGLKLDAEREITKAMMIEHGLMGYGNPDPNRVRGGQAETLQEYQLRLLERYRKWKKQCPRLTYAICFDRCSPTTGFSVPDIAYQRELDKSTVYKHLKKGFTLYLEVNRRS